MDRPVYISRFDAATQLGISLRTLDRYVKKKGIHTRREGKNLLLRFHDVERLAPDLAQRPEMVVSASSSLPSAETSAVASLMSEPVSHTAEMELRSMVGALQHQAAAREHKVELLSYKLGVAETKLAQSVPMKDFVDHQVKTAEESAAKQANILSLTYLYRRTKLIKNVYASIVVLIVLGMAFYFLAG